MKKSFLALAGIALASAAGAQDVIINEWSQGNGGNKEWIEAVVVNGPVDMRGWGFTDGTNGITTCAQLSQDAAWSALPTGTIVVIYNGADVDLTIVPDTDFNDGNFTVSVAHNNATLMVAGRNFQAFGNTTATDNARLLDAAGNVVHDWDQGDNAAFTASTLRPGANQTVQYDGNTAGGVSDSANWSRIASSVATPGQPNGGGSANDTWILGLRGVAADNPNISVPQALVQMGRIAPSTTQDLSIEVFNVGASAPLTVSGSTITGPDAARFSIEVQPAGIAAGGSGNLVLRFDPAGAAGIYNATLTIRSNDTSGDEIVLPIVASAADIAPYAGLFITEAVSTPTEDEFIEIQNTTGSPIDISSVILSDEDNSNTEGALKFPAGTIIGAGEVIVVATNNSVNSPVWFLIAPSGLRVFYDPIRAGESWVPPAGVTLTAMDDFTVEQGGTAGVIALPGDDGVALWHPLTVFNALYGPTAPSMCIDGLNYNDTVTTPINPINSNGDFDTQATRVGNNQPPSGGSIKRLSPTPNSASNVTFEISEGITPGVAFTVSNVEEWGDLAY